MHRFGMVVLILAAALIITPFALMRQTRAQPAYADKAFEATRDRLDKPVEEGQADRTWYWGPEPISDGILEPYAESPGGKRLVQYMDKARLEITQPGMNPDDPWFVSTGLLTRELISGSVQTGEFSYELRDPSDAPMAGDADNPWPTYSGFGHAADQMYLDERGTRATKALLPGGVTTYAAAIDDPEAEIVEYMTYDGPTGPVGYNIPAAFWQFMNASGTIWNGVEFVQAEPLMDWLFVMGLPISDPFWVSVQLDGDPAWVLIQAFERRVLTYTPSNPDGWQVEMGNVGRHYMEWRYADGGIDEPTPTVPPAMPTIPPVEPTPAPAEPTPVPGGSGPATDFFAMQVGNSWTYQDRETGDYYQVEITTRSTDFIDGEWLLVRRESRPDGSYELSYWDKTDTVLWLFGREDYAVDGTLVNRVTYSPEVRQIVTTLDAGEGWGSNAWIDQNGVRIGLVQFLFEVKSTGSVPAPAGVFETSRIVATRALSDGDNLIGPTEITSEFDFSPYYGIVRDDRGDDGPLLELVAYDLR